MIEKKEKKNPKESIQNKIQFIPIKDHKKIRALIEMEQ